MISSQAAPITYPPIIAQLLKMHLVCAKLVAPYGPTPVRSFEAADAICPRLGFSVGQTDLTALEDNGVSVIPTCKYRSVCARRRV